MCATVENLISDISKVHVTEDEVVLSFEGHQMKLDTANDAQKVHDAIEACQGLTTLILTGNTINIAAAEKIAAALKKCSNLKRALWSDIFTGRSKLESPPALKLMCNALMEAKVSLVELDLSDNAFGPAGADAIKDLLKSPCAYSLEVLRLNNDGLGLGGGRMIAESLISCWKSAKAAGKVFKLKVFVAGRNRLENDGAEALAGAFATIGTLEEITLPQNGIYCDGIRALASAFASNPNLRRISLEDNTLSIYGSASVAEALPKLNKLQVLNLNDCLLKSGGAMKLAKMLKYHCENIEELHITGNEINRSAALELGEALFAKRSLKKVDFGDNAIGEEGVTELIALFKDHDVGDRIIFSSEDGGVASDEEEDLQDMSDALEEIRESELDNFDSSELLDLKEEESAFYELVDEFLTTFDPQILLELGSEGPFLIMQRIEDELHNPYFGVHTLLQVSSVITPDCDEFVRDCAYLTCKDILTQSTHNAFVDILCQKLGLIKDEKGRMRRPKNLYGILQVLKQEHSEPYFAPLHDVLMFLVQKQKGLIHCEDQSLWNDFFHVTER